MQLQTFMAKGMRDALAEVRAQMGPDAVIVSSETAVDGSVIVRAAVEDTDSLDDIAFSDDAVTDTQIGTLIRAMPQFAAASGGAAASVPSSARSASGKSSSALQRAAALADALKPQATQNAEVRTMREKKNTRRGRRRSFDRAELLTIFAHHRLPDALAHALAEKSAGTGINDMTLALAAAIDSRMKSAPIDFSACQALVLLGPGGVGKTATAAKLAAHAQLAGRSVALIAADTEGAGAVARLGAFAEHLKVEFLSAGTPVQLERRVREVVRRGALAIADTAGFDARQPKMADAMKSLASVRDTEAIGVVSAMIDSEEMCEIAAALGRIGATRLVVTQLDQVRRFGALAGAAMTDGMMLAHTTRSPFVAGGLDALTPLILARLLVENEEESVQ